MHQAIIFSIVVHGGLLIAVLMGLGAPRAFTERAPDSLTVEVMTPAEAAEEAGVEIPPPPEEAQPLLPDLRFRPSLSPQDPSFRQQPQAPAGAEKASTSSPAERKAPQSSAAQEPPAQPERQERQGQAQEQDTPQRSGQKESRAAASAGASAGSSAAPASSPSGQAPPEGSGAATAEPPPDPAAAEAAFDIGSLARLYSLRLPPEFDSPATSTAQLSAGTVGAFKANLRKCWQQPGGIASGSPTRVVIRVFLSPDGRLAGEPSLVEASASPEGPHVFRAAINALSRCQPHQALPRERYEEWKVLDVSFSPREMAGG